MAIDINEVVRDHNYKVTITPPEHPKDACIRQIKDVVLFFVALLLILGVCFFCIYVLVDHSFSIDDKKWATSILFSIVSAFLGYLTGKNIN